MRVGLDVDDVLYPWYETAHRLCERAGITNGVVPRSWTPYAEYGCSVERWAEVLELDSMRLYRQPPYAGARAQLTRLRDAGHSIHLVTARGFMAAGREIRQHTAAWLEFHAMPHDSLAFSKDKRVVITDVFLDDAPHNYDQLLGHTEAYLMHAPHNHDAREGRRCVTNLAEFVDLVMAGAVSAA